MLSGCAAVIKWTSRLSLAALVAALSGQALAVGLGELRGTSVLGEVPRFELDVLGADRLPLDVTCFSLRQPATTGDLPFLKKGSLTLRRGSPPVLQITSHLTLSDPAIAVAVHVGCGQDVVREYVVLVGQPGKGSSSLPPLREQPREAADKAAPVRAPRPPAAVAPPSSVPPAVPSSGLAAVGLPPKAPAGDPVGAADDKVRAMEAQVAALQQRATDLTQKIEQVAPAVPAATESKPTEAPAVVPAAPVARPTAPAKKADEGWGLYLLFAAILLAILGWVGWRSYRQGRGGAGETEFAVPPIKVDARRTGEREERGGADLDVDPAAMAMPTRLEIRPPAAPGSPAAAGKGATHDSIMSIAAASLDENFEANPVMELAEIMLSFGRVKGAAQALQEFIDTNPKEALKPWIRLLDVYRMAGMRHEFERVAGELNTHFNVQVQRWEDGSSDSGHTRIDVLVDSERPVTSPTASGLESIPRVVDQVVASWQTGDAAAVLDDLLRDNRGGARVGFPLPVVDDLLFLIDLVETSKALEREAAKS